MNPILPLVALAGLLLVNRVLMPRLAPRPAAFWALFGVNVAVLVLVVWKGMPGTGGHGPARWVIAVLLVYHLVLYLQTRARLRDEGHSLEDERALLRQLREARGAGVASSRSPEEEVTPPEAVKRGDEGTEG